MLLGCVPMRINTHSGMYKAPKDQYNSLIVCLVTIQCGESEVVQMVVLVKPTWNNLLHVSKSDYTFLMFKT